MDLLINIDGGSRGNPGPASAGVTIRAMPGNTVLHEAGYHLGRATNNVAEYNGLLKALEVVERLKGFDGGKVHIQSDSELMVKQLLGEYRVKSPDLKPLYEEALARLRRLKSWKIEHVLRHKNARADELANMALDAGRDVIVVAGDGSAASVVGPTVSAGGQRPADGSTSTTQASPTSKSTHQPKAGAESRSTAQTPAGRYPPAKAAPLFADASLFSARLAASPGAACPAKCPAKTPFPFGPKLPPDFCVFAAQAVFDEDPTLWPDAHRTEAQTQCGKCGVTIHIERT